MSSSSSSSAAAAAAPAAAASQPVMIPKTVKVKSFTGNEFYDVNLTAKTCTCPNYEHVQSKNNGLCKHLKAAMENHPAIQLALDSE